MSRSEEFHGSRLASEAQIDHYDWERKDGDRVVRGTTVEAYHPDHGTIGKMELAEPDENGEREITDLYSTVRREGIATALWNHAHSAGLRPRHSAERTDEGDAWAKAVGGKAPKQDRVTSSIPASDSFAGY